MLKLLSLTALVVGTDARHPRDDDDYRVSRGGGRGRRFSRGVSRYGDDDDDDDDDDYDRRGGRRSRYSPTTRYSRRSSRHGDDDDGGDWLASRWARRGSYDDDDDDNYGMSTYGSSRYGRGDRYGASRYADDDDDDYYGSARRGRRSMGRYDDDDDADDDDDDDYRVDRRSRGGRRGHYRASLLGRTRSARGYNYPAYDRYGFDNGDWGERWDPYYDTGYGPYDDYNWGTDRGAAGRWGGYRGDYPPVRGYGARRFAEDGWSRPGTWNNWWAGSDYDNVHRFGRGIYKEQK